MVGEEKRWGVRRVNLGRWRRVKNVGLDLKSRKKLIPASFPQGSHTFRL